MRLGSVHRAAGAPTLARQVWRRALPILLDLDHPDAAGPRAELADPDRADSVA